MDTKLKLKNDILVGMKQYLDIMTMTILESVIVQSIQNLDIKESETLPATFDDTNDYIIQLFMAKKAPYLTSNTVEQYMRTLNEFIAYINKPLNKVVENDIQAYLFAKKKGGLNTNVSLNNARRNLSAFFTWMRKNKLRSDNPCDGIEPFVVVEHPIEHLEADEYEILKSGCKNARDRAMMEFFRCTAMRRGEIPIVRICDIDFRTGQIMIYGEKGKKYRLVLLDSVAMHFLKEYMNERGVDENSKEPVFTHLYNPAGLQKEGIYCAIKSIARRAKIDKNVYPHLFRKTTATNICKRGGTEEEAGEYLGHAPKNVTGKHYTFKSNDHIIRIFKEKVEAV